MKISEHFYQRQNVVKIAQQLLGKTLFTNIQGDITGGIIVETEAYSFKEHGCHAYDNRKTERNKVMFESGGISYVYLCYGIHHLFNVVTNQLGKADAVLVRALEPTMGYELMKTRMKVSSLNRITSGPGKLTKALGINRSHNGKNLEGIEIWIEDMKLSINPKNIVSSTRIGIDYAGEDAMLPWRFTIRDNQWISK